MVKKTLKKWVELLNQKVKRVLAERTVIAKRKYDVESIEIPAEFWELLEKTKPFGELARGQGAYAINYLNIGGFRVIKAIGNEIKINSIERGD
jgi:hypothetical protein